MGLLESISAVFALLVAAVIWGIRKGAQREQDKQKRQQSKVVQQAKEVQRDTESTDTDTLRAELGSDWVRKPPSK